MAKYGWLLDPKRCIECRACEAACKQWNGVETGIDLRYRRVIVSEAGKYPNMTTQALSLACNHCDNPWCVKACPVHAISRGADGLVHINRDACIGCSMCVKLCPYQVPQLNVKAGKAEKCTMCPDRIEAGLQPACASLCPTDALKWGKWDDIKGLGAGQAPGFTDPKYTQPAIRFIAGKWGK